MKGDKDTRICNRVNTLVNGRAGVWPVYLRCYEATGTGGSGPSVPGVRGLGQRVQRRLSARRARMMERLGTEAMAVLFSAPERNYSLDVDYEYRQDSNLYYLTGLLRIRFSC